MDGIKKEATRECKFLSLTRYNNMYVSIVIDINIDIDIDCDIDINYGNFTDNRSYS